MNKYLYKEIYMKAVALFSSAQVTRRPQKWFGFVFFYTPAPGLPTVVTIKLEGLDPYTFHAIHIHEKLIPPGKFCDSAGPHWNPLNQPHGSILLDEKKRHAGDLCNNVLSDGSGMVCLRYKDSIIDLWNPHLSPVGRSVVIHEGFDDLGLEGVFVRSNESGEEDAFHSYENLSTRTILKLYSRAHHQHNGSDNIPDKKKKLRHQTMITKLMTESRITGNAGGRMACTNIEII
jgi:Cu/Zn superoxide dismutase